MVFRTGEIAHIALPLIAHSPPCWEIGLAFTIRTLAQNLDFDYHMPPLVVKTKKPAVLGGWMPVPAGRRLFN